MHLHLAKVRRAGKTYVYGQLLESFRRPEDGMPTQRVIRSLGRLTETEIANWRALIEANRRGERLAVAAVARHAKPLTPTANLRYLDVAVLLELWREWGLGKLLDQVMPPSGVQVAASDVVAALTLQRCVDPGSKLYAERWFPTTALPELLRIAPEQFNNTRVHRTLEAVDKVTPQLMQRLPAIYGHQGVKLCAMFLDGTDARFVGEGPPLAERAKTKEGIVEKKIGIVLLCDDNGFPLRWHVISGRSPEPAAMRALLGEVRGLPWLKGRPIVMDRIMGATAELARLLEQDVHFVTALRVPEFGAYCDTIPHQAFADLEPGESDEAAIAEATRRATLAGLAYVKPTMFVMDVGEVEHDAPEEHPAPTSDRAARAMTFAREMREMVERGEAESLNSAARRLGITSAAGKGYRKLLKLVPEVQQLVVEGQAAGLSLARLVTIAALDGAAQVDALRARTATSARRAPPVAPSEVASSEVASSEVAPSEVAPSEAAAREVAPSEVAASEVAPSKVAASEVAASEVASSEVAPSKVAASEVAPTTPARVRVRVVVQFNPALFVEHRRNAQRQLNDVAAAERELNDSLASPRSRRTKAEAEQVIDRLLRDRGLLTAYRVSVEEKEAAPLRVVATLDPVAWQRRRRYDGFSVLVTHPAVTMKPAEVCELYRAKDAVEQDFRVIKSLVKLRPIYHHTDAKVRAHVTLCMLALVLTRALDRRLTEDTVEAALETLRTCHLNRYESGATTQSTYLVTQPTEEQARLLRILGLAKLADDDDVTATLRPR